MMHPQDTKEDENRAKAVTSWFLLTSMYVCNNAVAKAICTQCVDTHFMLICMYLLYLTV